LGFGLWVLDFGFWMQGEDFSGAFRLHLGLLLVRATGYALKLKITKGNGRVLFLWWEECVEYLDHVKRRGPKMSGLVPDLDSRLVDNTKTTSVKS